MHLHSLKEWEHDHQFDSVSRTNERRTVWVVVLTAVTMVVEIAAGVLYGSMALLADGWHMGTHVAALGISVFAYRYARRHADDRRFTFGTGKVGVLGAFASAMILAIVALAMIYESAHRLVSPQLIQFNQAIVVAVVGLVVNLASALILGGRGEAGGDEAPAHGHHHDHNLRAAYLHVVADALTSVLAIVALLAGLFLRWVWLDPIMGIVGALVIGWWSFGLIRDTSRILLDGAVPGDVLARIRAPIEADLDNCVSDLHVWKVAGNKLGAIVSVVTSRPRPAVYYKELLVGVKDLAHVTVEVHQCSCPPDRDAHAAGPPPGEEKQERNHA
jgi:cation diffusion facilitator family transporter